MVAIEGLRALAALRHKGTVTAAAQQLGFTPSAVSQQLTRLQSELKAELLRRHGRLLEFTPSGLLMADVAEEMLSLWESATSRLEQLNGAISGTIRISAFPTAAREIAPAALRSLSELYPELKVSFVEARSHKTLELLREGAVDLAVSHDWQDVPFEPSPGIRSVVIGEDIADIVVSKKNPLAPVKGLKVSHLKGAAWVLETDSVAFDLLTALFEKNGYELNVPYAVREYGTQITFIRENLAVGLIPRYGRGPLPEDVTVVPSSFGTTRRVYASVRPAALTRPAIRAVIAALRIAAQGAPADFPSAASAEPVTMKH